MTGINISPTSSAKQIVPKISEKKTRRMVEVEKANGMVPRDVHGRGQE